MPLTLDIITQEKQVLSETVDALVAPAVMGEVTILPSHIPLFTKLNDGVVKIKKGSVWSEFAVSGGFMDVGPSGTVTILADSATRSDDINLAATEAAIAAAQETMKNKQSEIEYKMAESSLRKALLELKVVRKRQPQQNLSDRMT